jgi:dolichol kinase
MSRTSSPSELLYGPLQMTCIMCYVGLTRFMTPTGIIVMASLVGDGIAAMVGLEYGKHVYRVHPLGGTKSVEGTIGCAFGTMGGAVFYSYMTGIDVSGGYGALATYGCVSAIVEATALRNYDNMLLALAMEMAVRHYAKLGGTPP